VKLLSSHRHSVAATAAATIASHWSERATRGQDDAPPDVSVCGAGGR
jgi:hypothetical protein